MIFTEYYLILLEDIMSIPFLRLKTERIKLCIIFVDINCITIQLNIISSKFISILSLVNKVKKRYTYLRILQP